MSTSLKSVTFATALALAGALIAAPTAANAAQFVLSQTHTRGQVYAACDAAGGVKLRGENGGYGCYNPENGNMVACADNGTCTGYTPGRTSPDRTLGVLGAAQVGGLTADPYSSPTRQRPTGPIAPRTATQH